MEHLNQHKKNKVSGKIKFDIQNLTKKHKTQAKNWGKKTCIIELDSDYVGLSASYLKLRFGLELEKSVRKSHITFISESIKNIKEFNKAKKKYHNQEIELEIDYDKGLQFSDSHIWFKVHNDSRNILYDIREYCGLPRKYIYGFHMTIGRVGTTKHKLDHFKRLKEYYDSGLVDY